MEAGKWYILGNPFISLDGATTYKLNDAFAGSGFAAGDVLYTMDDTGIFTSHYWNVTNGGWSTHKVAWREDNTDYSASTAVYLHKLSDGSFTFFGKVASIEVEVGDEAGEVWSLTSVTYPESKKLGELTWTGFTSGDVLYTMDDTGLFTPHYWNTANNGWSTHKVAWREDTTPLAVGQALYIRKRSAGKGTISHQ